MCPGEQGAFLSTRAVPTRGRAARHVKETSDQAEPDAPLFVQLGLTSLEDWQAGRRAIRNVVWENRRAVARWGIDRAEDLAQFRANFIVDDLLTDEERRKKREEEKRVKSNQFATLAFVAAGSAVLLRVGGRAAVLNLLGLDMLQETDVKAGIMGVLDAAETLDPVSKLLAVFLLWAVAKVLCLDFVTFPLGVAGGVLFGVLQGTLVSCVGATLGSSVAFLLSRTFLYEKTRGRLDTSPGLRAIENVVAGEGAKTVFTLRLAPVLPLPIGGYAYVYGLTRLQWQDFALGTFAGSAKPYFLDAYLGSFFKDGLVQPTGDDDLGDVILFVTLVATIATGSFASELATRSFAELGDEIESFDAALARDRRDSGLSADPLMSSQGLRDSLGFWGLQSSDFPELLKNVCDTLHASQEVMRGVYAEQWALLQRDGGNPESSGGHGSEGHAEHRMETWSQSRPELAEAESGWAFRPGTEAAQALLTLPVLFEAVGAYSKPVLWPELYAAAQKELAESRALQADAADAWATDVDSAYQAFGRTDGRK